MSIIPWKAPSLSPLSCKSPPNRKINVPSAPIRGSGGKSVVSDSMRSDPDPSPNRMTWRGQIDPHRSARLAANDDAPRHGARASGTRRARQAGHAIGRQGDERAARALEHHLVEIEPRLHLQAERDDGRRVGDLAGRDAAQQARHRDAFLCL